MSHTNSLASSQRHILADNDQSMSLEPPNAPFAGLAQPPGSPKGSFRSLTPSNTIGGDGDTKGMTNSLSVNYLPQKFSRPVSPGSGSGIYKRKGGKGGKGMMVPKQGGGREAFRSGEARMPGENDDDYDGVDVSNVRATIFGAKGHKPKLRWNKFKWILFFFNLVVRYHFSSNWLISLISK